MQKWVAGLNAGFEFQRRRADDEVADLIDRIRGLVAEQRRLDGSAERERREAYGREIDRLQDRLAIAVKRELGS
jgi:hypothetical protein